uniref:NBS-LRR protein n=1 Tax=Cicer arietinum TaxID=3827 RepID=W0M0H6_CICAR|nr:NBS-LRR protein [Cicer arietinum]
MADPILGVVFENLTSLLRNEFSTLSGIKSKAQKLSTTLDLIKAVLQDADHRQLTDRSIMLWLQQLKDAVYVLDDILDQFSTQSRRLRGSSSFKPKNIMFRHEIGNKFKEITRRFDQIAECKNKFLLREDVTVRESSIEVAEWRQTSSIIAEPKVYGRENDKDKIVEFLLTQARDSDFLSVYPIVGLGGVGKTTLSQLVYNDDRVQELFQGKRYLLVLDDVWNQNQQLEFGLSQEKWNKLKSVLLCGSKGSSILVSTRDEVVAEIMGTCQAHLLSGLSENECWLLFKQYAFRHDREERAELVAIGKDIVKKCGGLPLAAQALGGLMSSRSGEKEWLEIKESKLWALPHENSILPALRLSYFHLTPTLKQCFAFCAIFPKGMKIMKEELIHLWMANGFIASRENLEVEDVGSMIWNELCQKSFFQDIQINDYLENISFKMHDLVHDLAQSVMAQECMILENANMTNLSEGTHHISFHSTSLLSFNKGAFKKIESLRTLFQFNYYKKIKPKYFPYNHSLRVLCTTSLPISSLGSLIHLRYLELRGLDIKIFPDSIYSLQNLEILKIINFVKLSCLPKRLACLQNLRHLVIEGCYSLSRMFPYIGKLSSLRTLSVYFVSLEGGHTLAELCDLNLGGKLNIKGLQNVGSLSEAQEANLMCKKDLRELCLSWKSNCGFSETPTISAQQVLEGLQPHTNLKWLKIHCYQGLYFPTWINFLSSLVALELRDCKNCVRLSPLGKLPSLKQLELCQMHNVKYMDDDDESHNGMEVRVFPSLEVLSLKELPNLEGLLKVEREEMFHCLSSLTIFNCPKLGLPCLPSVKDLSVYGCNNELLKSISTFYGLTNLDLYGGNQITSFPERMLRNLTCLQTLKVFDFPKLKELPIELEPSPEQICEGLQSLRTMKIIYCEGLRYLPEGMQYLTSLEVLEIRECPTLEERCKEGTGEDWDKIAHIPKLNIGWRE